jgi:hypothetical protein
MSLKGKQEHSSRNSMKMTNNDSNNLQFPWKLHLLLKECEANGNNSIISWLPDGISLKAHDKDKFANLIMPKYFSSNKYKSFQRNLNLWGFHTERKEPNKGAIFHPCFIRGQPEGCHLMERIKIKRGSTSWKPTTPEEFSGSSISRNRSACSQDSATTSSVLSDSHGKSLLSLAGSHFTLPPLGNHFGHLSPPLSAFQMYPQILTRFSMSQSSDRQLLQQLNSTGPQLLLTGRKSLEQQRLERLRASSILTSTLIASGCINDPRLGGPSRGSSAGF